MIKVLSVIQTPVYGGPHNQIIQLYDDLRSRGYEYVVVLPDINEGAIQKIQDKGIKFFSIKINRLRASLNIKYHWLFIKEFYSTVNKIRAIIRSEEISIVQVCGLMSFQGGIAGYLEKKKVVWQLLSDFAPLPLRMIFVQLLNLCADITMTTGRAIHKKHLGLKKVIPNLIFYPPVDPDIYKKKELNEEVLAQDFNTDTKKIIIGTVGNFNRQKAHDRMVEIASILNQKYPSRLKFVVIGTLSDSNKKYYEKNILKKAEILNRGHDEVIKFINPKRPIVEYLNGLDIFLMTSIAEGVPTSVLEAMSCELPVISTSVGAMNEIVFDGYNGFLCKSSDTKKLSGLIEILLHDPQLRTEMGKNGRKLIEERFSLSVCAQNHIRAFSADASRNYHYEEPVLL